MALAGTALKAALKIIASGAKTFWQPSTAYSIGDRVYHDNPLRRYSCAGAGTSAGSGGPTGTGSGIADGSAHWNFQATATPTVADAALDWANAYHAFAKTGQANGVPAVIADAARDALAASLTSAFGAGSAGGASSGLQGSLDAYWLLATFVGMVAPPVPGGGVGLISDLTGIFGSVGGTHDSKAGEVRDALLTYTNAVLVTFPPGTPFPVI